MIHIEAVAEEAEELIEYLYERLREGDAVKYEGYQPERNAYMGNVKIDTPNRD